MLYGKSQLFQETSKELFILTFCRRKILRGEALILEGPFERSGPVSGVGRLGDMRWCGDFGGPPRMCRLSPNPPWGFWACFAGRGSLRLQSSKGRWSELSYDLETQGGEKKKLGVVPPVCEAASWGNSRSGSELAPPFSSCVTLGPRACGPVSHGG